MEFDLAQGASGSLYTERAAYMSGCTVGTTCACIRDWRGGARNYVYSWVQTVTKKYEAFRNMRESILTTQLC